MTTALVASLAAIAPAAAQQSPQFDGQVFRPSADSEVTIWTEDTHTAPDGYASARGYLQYARAPVRWRGADGESERLVSDVLEIDALGAVRWRSLRLGAHLPLYVLAGGVLGRTEPGLGDIAVDLKGTILRREDSPIGVGAAIMGRLTLPTASVDVPLGDAGMGWELIAIADRQFGPFTTAFNLGTRAIPRATYEDLVWDDQVFTRFGAGWRWTEDMGVAAELAAQTNWASGKSPAGTAIELMGSGWTWLADSVVLRGGVSLGLTRSPGAPVARLFAGIGFEPDPAPDKDHDGVLNRFDHCPDEPEDLDGYQDDDGCADPSFAAEVRLLGRGGGPVDGRVTLTGPDQAELLPGNRIVSLHPGTYQVRAEAPGYRPWTGSVEIAPTQGERLELPLEPLDGQLRVFAVDAAGNPVPGAKLSVDGDAPGRADVVLNLAPGEHAVVVTAPGFAAGTASVQVEAGALRQLPVVLQPGATPPP
ncbi:MAG: PEGA domain-containing protein [Myxococcota bacterium]